MPGGAAKVETKSFVLKSKNQGADDGGGVSLSGAWTAKRVQCFAESDDGIHWTNEQVVLRADEQDPPSWNIQYLFVIQRGGYYLGFLTMHDEAGFFRIQLAWSRDGIEWKRAWREPWLDVGPEDAFDMGMVLGPADPIVKEREMWFPYGGFPIRHDTKETNWQSAIGLATTRLDGFSAWEVDGQANTESELMTQPFRCNGDRLLVNAELEDGSLRVEVLDENGKPIDGRDAASCKPMTGDTLAHSKETGGPARWQADQSLEVVQGRIIQLRFLWTKGRLFSFRIADEQTEQLPVPSATTH